MRRIVSKINVLLGAMIVMLTGTGCKSQKNAVNNGSQRGKRHYQEEKIVEPIICMYGIPAEVLREQEVKEQEAKNQESEEKAQTPETVEPATTDSVTIEQ